MKDQLRSTIPVPKIEEDCYDWYQRHEAKIKAVKEHKYDVIFFGDSITHFFAGEDGPHNGTEIWDAQIASRFNALNLGYGFDRTQNVLWRIDHGELDGQSPKVFVLNIGTNQFSITGNYNGDTAAVAAEGVKAVIAKLHEKFPAAHIVVMAVFPRGGRGDCMRLVIRELNEIVKSYVKTADHCEFLDLTRDFTHEDETLKEELYADKCCHPNAAGYQIWADAVKPVLKRELGC